MKRWLLPLLVLIFSTAKSQISPWVVTDNEIYKKNKKMTYDGKSKILFFYEDLLEIPFDMKDKKKKKKESQNLMITSNNDQRLKHLENKFPYSYDIIYPNSYNYKEDSSEYRYVIVMVSTSGGVPMMTSNGMMTGGGAPSYTVKVLDVWTKQRKKVKRRLGSFNFYDTVGDVRNWIEIKKRKK